MQMKTPRRWMIAALKESTKPGILMPWHRDQHRGTSRKIVRQISVLSTMA
jgi:hypothetical protein